MAYSIFIILFYFFFFCDKYKGCPFSVQIGGAKLYDPVTKVSKLSMLRPFCRSLSNWKSSSFYKHRNGYIYIYICTYKYIYLTFFFVVNIYLTLSNCKCCSKSNKH